jgi:Domain of unknown function (DUF4410)
MIMKTLVYRTSCRNRSNNPTWSRQISVAILASFLLVPFCMGQENNSQCSAGQPAALSRADRNKVIYVKDFDLDPNNFKQDKGGITGKGYLLPAAPMSLLGRKHQDPEAAATNLTRLMTKTLVSELQKAGFNTRRLLSFEAPPTEGLVVSGAFTQLNEGNQMRRALLGFGAGNAKIELYVTLADVSCSGHQLYDTSVQNGSGRMPGGAIALNPYAGAAGFVAKFAMTKNAPEKMVKKTAAKIAAELTKQLNSDSLVAADQGLKAH